jgi:hypothetical protein
VLELTINGWAHSEQNLAVGGFAKPHRGQAAANGVAHSLQNFAPSRFSLPQPGQINSVAASDALGVERIVGAGPQDEGSSRPLPAPPPSRPPSLVAGGVRRLGCGRRRE